MKVAFIDRDGTIIRDYSDDAWSSIESPEFIPGSIDALKLLAQKGYAIIIVTNQYLIDEGFISLAQYHQIARQMLRELKRQDIDILEVFYCPHTRASGCRSCKPRPGMIERALEKYPDINIAESFVVGDSDCDAKLAEYFNMRFFGIDINTEHVKASSVTSLQDAAMRVSAE